MDEKFALLSVSDKTGLVEFAKGLVESGYSLLSTGGTAKALREAGLEVTEISDFTGQDEMLDGRVKTLHPKVFGGILADYDNPTHVEQVKQHGLQRLSLVCVNLYPFAETMQKQADLKEILEDIDIGGPSLIRAAAKNYEQTMVVVTPKDYEEALSLIKDGNLDSANRRRFAAKAFSYTARYDVIIHRFFEEKLEKKTFPSIYNFTFEKIQDLRYGENPHQKAALYKQFQMNETGVPNAKKLQGKELSYNNILDSNEALSIIKDFERPTAAVIKHNNPSGVASANTIAEAFRKAHEADPKSAFGSVVALNGECDKETAELMKPLFIEVVICPGFTDEAKEILKEKTKLRLLETGPIKVDYSGPEMRKVASGLLVQTRQFPSLKEGDLKVVTKRKPTEQELRDLLFAWKVNKNVKSNAVVFVKDEVTVGIGAGQMSRVDAVNLVGIKPESATKGSVMSSDAYFPFRDGLDSAVKLGASAVIHPGGSIRDEEVIKAADEHGIAMVLTGVRLFKH